MHDLGHRRVAERFELEGQAVIVAELELELLALAVCFLAMAPAEAVAASLVTPCTAAIFARFMALVIVARTWGRT